MKTDIWPIMNGKSSLVPTPKVFTGFSAGTITALIVYELHTWFNIDLAPLEASFLTAILSFAASWFAPKSPAPPVRRGSKDSSVYKANGRLRMKADLVPAPANGH